MFRWTGKLVFDRKYFNLNVMAWTLHYFCTNLVKTRVMVSTASITLLMLRSDSITLPRSRRSDFSRQSSLTGNVCDDDHKLDMFLKLWSITIGYGIVIFHRLRTRTREKIEVPEKKILAEVGTKAKHAFWRKKWRRLSGIPNPIAAKNVQRKEGSIKKSSNNFAWNFRLFRDELVSEDMAPQKKSRTEEYAVCVTYERRVVVVLKVAAGR